MSDYDNNNYSFWAEQSNQQNNQQGNNATSYNMYTYQQTPEMNAEPEKKKDRKVLRFIGRCFGALGLGSLAAAAFIGVNVAYYTVFPEAPSGFKGTVHVSEDEMYELLTVNLSSNTQYKKSEVVDVVKASMPSVVAITTKSTVNSWYGKYESEGGGSGFIIAETEEELMIATNSHVVSDVDTLSVTFIDDTVAEATVRADDSVADLAVITVAKSALTKETLGQIKIAKLADAEDIEVGEQVVAIGNALGYGQSVTVGCVSALNREITSSDGVTRVLLQTDAAINSGNSGGALLNMKGEVIGINSMKLSATAVEGIGFAIPVSEAASILEDLMTREILRDEEKGYLNVYISTVTEDVSKYYNWPIGIYISSVIEGGAADLAGLQTGDIITGVNGVKVTDTDQLIDRVTSYRYGTEITITYRRNVKGTFEEFETTAVLQQQLSEN